MEFIPPDVYTAANDLAPAHRATLNHRRKKSAAHRLRQCNGLSWTTSETLSCTPEAALNCVGAILLIFFAQRLLHKWKIYKGTHPVAARFVSERVATYQKVEHRVHKVWKRQKHKIKKRLFHLKLRYIVFRYFVRRKAARVWARCKERGAIFFERIKSAYLKAASFIYRHLPFIRVSAVVIFLHLFMSGDVEPNPGPQGGS